MTLAPDLHMHWLHLVAPILLYAETHFRIWNILSRYFKREPEIIVDAPHRIFGDDMPIFLCIKDAHRYPIQLQRMIVRIIAAGKNELLLDHNFHDMPITDSLWTELHRCAVPADFNGRVKIEATIHYLCRGRRKTCVSDNYSLTSHAPFDVFIDAHPRPRGDNWRFGDMHTHSHLTSDQVEFGAPFEISAAMARSMELDFFAAADHSYDLDDRPDNFLVNDPNLPKWKLLWERVERLNKEADDFVIIPGEELSSGNSKNRNVHHLVLNNRRFFEGKGDGAEKWLRTRPHIKSAKVPSLLEEEALSFAAHPEVKPPLLQKLLLRRGVWTPQDYRTPGLHGVQMWNGDKEHFLHYGLPRWIQLLLDDRKLTLIAGTDAHGNFNRFRQIGLPHFSIREDHRQIFGAAVTGVYIEKDFNLASLLEGLRQGRTIVTDGPFAAFRLHHADGVALIGDSVGSRQGTLFVDVKSSPSYGEIKKLTIVLGDISLKKETQKHVTAPLGSLEFSDKIFLENLPQPGYVRLELETESEKKFHCFTNPVFIR